MCALRENAALYPVCDDHVEILGAVCKMLFISSLCQWHIAHLPDKSSHTGRIAPDMIVLYVCLSKMLGTKEISSVSLLGNSVC